MDTGQRQRGVTLIEAGIVVAISAITVSSAAPGFNRFIEKQRLEGAAAQLAADLHFARAESVLRNAGLRLSVQNKPWGSCYVVHSGAADECVCSETGPAQCSGDAREVKTVQWPLARGIVLQGNVGSILFDPLHGTSTPTGTLKVVSAGGRALHHVVNVMGRVRTCSPQGGVPGYVECA
jgi:type IV fimbrial biogenesis protein FimT